jgi:hypothetical protein
MTPIPIPPRPMPIAPGQTVTGDGSLGVPVYAYRLGGWLGSRIKISFTADEPIAVGVFAPKPGQALLGGGNGVLAVPKVTEGDRTSGSGVHNQRPAQLYIVVMSNGGPPAGKYTLHFDVGPWSIF